MLGGVAAALVFCGVFAPTGAEILDQANFIGYVLWSLWLIAFGIVLLARRGAAVAVAALGAATA